MTQYGRKQHGGQESDGSAQQEAPGQSGEVESETLHLSLPGPTQNHQDPATKGETNRDPAAPQSGRCSVNVDPQLFPDSPSLRLRGSELRWFGSLRCRSTWTLRSLQAKCRHEGGRRPRLLHPQPGPAAFRRRSETRDLPRSAETHRVSRVCPRCFAVCFLNKTNQVDLPH